MRPVTVGSSDNELSLADAAALERVVAWLGLPWSQDQTARLCRYAYWLRTEAGQIGGIGPAEIRRVWDRHVLDSLVFAVDVRPDGDLLDLGSGVGLPGIPLAVALPGHRLHLLDRSGRRVDALRRVARMLDIDIVVHQDDVGAHRGRYDRVVLRASLTLEAAFTRVPDLLEPLGDMVFGLGRGANSDAAQRWRQDPASPPPGTTVAVVETPPGVLDSPAWLLRMAAQ